MEVFRARLPEFQGGEHALAKEALGRWELEGDHRQEGEDLLRSSIDEAKRGELATTDPAARRALAYSYTALIFDAGKRGDAERALQLFQEERGAGETGGLPAQCLLAVTYDAPERILAVVRGAAAGPARVFNWTRDTPLPENLKDLLLPAVREQLSGCRKVDVLARAPVYGRPGLLPSDMAWSYQGVVAQGPAPAIPRRHLVVQEVSLSPARRALKPVPRWKVPEVPGESVEELRQQEATPQVVLRWMEEATDITFIAHALVQPESAEAYLVLAPDSTGRDTLKASEIQSAKLRGHPLVVLTSCQGAHPSPVLHEARNLPAAFLRAGARAVLAASDKVPGREGPEFFGEVRASIQQGTAPAEALRAVRTKWKDEGRGAPWLDGVLLFE
jgi:CHAT domain-containing protein